MRVPIMENASQSMHHNSACAERPNRPPPPHSRWKRGKGRAWLYLSIRSSWSLRLSISTASIFSCTQRRAHQEKKASKKNREKKPPMEKFFWRARQEEATESQRGVGSMRGISSSSVMGRRASSIRARFSNLLGVAKLL